MKSAAILAGISTMFLATQSLPADAAVFTMNGQTYNVDHITGTGPDKALVELDFGTNITPDAHLFAFQWDPATSQNGRTMLSALQSGGTGISFADTYYPAFGSYLLNTLWLNAQQPPDAYPTSFWNYFSSTDGASWLTTDFGYDQTPVANGQFYAWGLQHDDPNINHDYSDPNAPFLPPSHIPAVITAVPEPASLTLLAGSSIVILFRRRR